MARWPGQEDSIVPGATAHQSSPATCIITLLGTSRSAVVLFVTIHLLYGMSIKVAWMHESNQR